MLSGGMRRSSESLLQRAQSMSEAAGFQAPPELINAMELLAGEAPYPAPADTAAPGEHLCHTLLEWSHIAQAAGRLTCQPHRACCLHRCASRGGRGWPCFA